MKSNKVSNDDLSRDITWSQQNISASVATSSKNFNCHVNAPTHQAYYNRSTSVTSNNLRVTGDGLSTPPPAGEMHLRNCNQFDVLLSRYSDDGAGAGFVGQGGDPTSLDWLQSAHNDATVKACFRENRATTPFPSVASRHPIVGNYFEEEMELASLASSATSAIVMDDTASYIGSQRRCDNFPESNAPGI